MPSGGSLGVELFLFLQDTIPAAGEVEEAETKRKQRVMHRRAPPQQSEPGSPEDRRSSALLHECCTARGAFR